MATLSVFNQVSLDGYFVDGSGDMSWAHKRDDAEWDAYTAENASGGGVLVFGRVTYQMMAGFWPTPAARAMNALVAERMNNLPKVVFSRTLDQGHVEQHPLDQGRHRGRGAPDEAGIGAEHGGDGQWHHRVAAYRRGSGRRVPPGAEPPRAGQRTYHVRRRPQASRAAAQEHAEPSRTATSCWPTKRPPRRRPAGWDQVTFLQRIPRPPAGLGFSS